MSTAKKKEEKKDVATIEQNGALAAVPEYMKKYAGAGGENVEASKLEIPRITLLQALSKPVAEGEMKQGEFYHTVLEESLGKEIEIVPLLFRSQYILWNPRENGGGILARADDGKHWSPAQGEFKVKIDKKGTQATWKLANTVAESGLANWGTYNPTDPNSYPAATELYTFLVVFPQRPDLGVAVLAMQRSQIKVARKWLTQLKLSELPFFGQKFILKSELTTNKQNDSFQNFKFARAGMVDEAQFKKFASLYDNFKDTVFQVKDLEEMQEEGGDGAEGAPDNTEY